MTFCLTESGFVYFPAIATNPIRIQLKLFLNRFKFWNRSGKMQLSFSVYWFFFNPGSSFFSPIFLKSFSIEADRQYWTAFSSWNGIKLVGHRLFNFCNSTQRCWNWGIELAFYWKLFSKLFFPNFNFSVSQLKLEFTLAHQWRVSNRESP